MKTTTTLFSAIIVNPDTFTGLSGNIHMDIHMDRFKINGMSVKSVIHADCAITGNLNFHLPTRLTDEMFYFEVYDNNTLHIRNVGTFDYIGNII